MDASVREVEVLLDLNDDGSPIAYTVGNQEYCRFSWARGLGPPFSRGIYMWLNTDDQVLYVGKATSDHTSHLYRRITAYKRATPGKTQLTSLRVNAEILAHARGGGAIRLLCLALPEIDPAEITRVEEVLILRARPPWNRKGNPHPRSVADAMRINELLAIDLESGWPPTVSINL